MTPQKLTVPKISNKHPFHKFEGGGLFGNVHDKVGAYSRGGAYSMLNGINSGILFPTFEPQHSSHEKFQTPSNSRQKISDPRQHNILLDK